MKSIKSILLFVIYALCIFFVLVITDIPTNKIVWIAPEKKYWMKNVYPILFNLMVNTIAILLPSLIISMILGVVARLISKKTGKITFMIVLALLVLFNFSIYSNSIGQYSTGVNRQNVNIESENLNTYKIEESMQGYKNILNKYVLESDTIMKLNQCKEYTIDKEKIECIIYLALKNDDPEFCKLLHNINQDNTCYTFLAVDNKDMSACDIIDEPTSRAICCVAVAPVSSTDLITCCNNNFSQDEQNSCNFILALQNKNVSYCDLIDALAFRSGCYYQLYQKQIIIKKHIIDYCDGYIKIEERVKCYSSFAYRAKDKSYCHYLKEQKNIDECYRLTGI